MCTFLTALRALVTPPTNTLYVPTMTPASEAKQGDDRADVADLVEEDDVADLVDERDGADRVDGDVLAEVTDSAEAADDAAVVKAETAYES